MPPNQRAALGIGRTFQNLALFGHMSVLDNIMVGRHHLLKHGFSPACSTGWAARSGRRPRIAREVEEIIDFLEIQHVRKATAGMLSYGLRKRVELARAIALKPKLILLDEPMAGMNLEEKEDMARFIVDLNEEWGMTVVMIEHDMGVVMDISHRVMVLDFGRKIAEGTPEACMADPHVSRAYLGEAASAVVQRRRRRAGRPHERRRHLARAAALQCPQRPATRWRCGRRNSASGGDHLGGVPRRGTRRWRSACRARRRRRRRRRR